MAGSSLPSYLKLLYGRISAGKSFLLPPRTTYSPYQIDRTCPSLGHAHPDLGLCPSELLRNQLFPRFSVFTSEVSEICCLQSNDGDF